MAFMVHGQTQIFRVYTLFKQLVNTFDIILISLNHPMPCYRNPKCFWCVLSLKARVGGASREEDEEKQFVIAWE